MNDSLQSSIEMFLLEKRDWVSATEICARFAVNKRQLRQVDDKPGLCTSFAISGNAGYKHFSLATDAEWNHYEARETKIHGSALDNVRHKKELRLGLVKRRPPMITEKVTGQGLLFMGSSLAAAHQGELSNACI